MAGRINWKDFFVDMIGILIGITIAFQLQNWKENKTDRKLETQYLASLSSDLEKDITSLTQFVDTTNYAVRMGSALTTDIIRNDLDNDSIFFHVLSMFHVTFFKPHNTTYQSLISSGDMKLIDDFEMRTAISDLYQRQHTNVEVADRSHVDTFYDLIYPYVNKHVSFTGTNRFQDNTFMKSNEFVNLAFANRAFLARQGREYEEALAMSEDLKHKIDSILQ